ncbi:MAG: HAD-IIIA family hydrolase [Planctomycetota bacterium]
MGKPAVFLDRDNTLIRNDGDLGDPDLVELLPGAASAVASLRGLGFRIVVVTNQGGVARGKYAEDDVDAVHQRLAEQVSAAANGASFDAFYYCPYHPQGKVPEYTREHEDRKPSPGMLLRAAHDLGLDLSASWMVGDQMRDVQAGAAAGTRTVLLREDAAQLRDFEPGSAPGVTAQPAKPGEAAPAKPDLIAASLVEAVRLIAQQRHAVESPEPEPGSPQVAGRKWDAAAIARLQKQAKPKRPAAQPPAEGTAPDDDEPAQAAPTAQPAAPQSFRPWTTAQSDQDEAPIATSKFSRALARVRESSKDDPPAEAAAAPQAQDDSPNASTTDATSDAATPPLTPPAESPPTGRSERLLRSILQELRNQRGRSAGDMTTLRIAALVLQAGAALCLAGALVMGAGDTPLFARWVAIGVLLQLAVIALLLFER